jgi:hypothetical protein
MQNKPPFTIKRYADVSTQEPFVARIGLGLSDVLDGTELPNKQEIKEELMSGVLFGSLVPAFGSLKELRALTGRSDVAEITQIKNFDDMYRHLWAAYKDRMQKVMALMGFDIGFAFTDEKSFVRGCEQFRAKHPGVDAALLDMLAVDRATWQSQLAKFRNKYLEHQSLRREYVADLYTLDKAEIAFHNVWEAIEDILAILAASKLYPGVQLVEIPEATRNPQCPKRFGFAWAGPPPLATQQTS